MQHANAVITRAHKRRDNAKATRHTCDYCGCRVRNRVERDLERDMVAQVVEATQDGPWNNPPNDPLSRERRYRAFRRQVSEARRLALTVLWGWKDAGLTEHTWARIDECDPMAAWKQSLAYTLRDHHGIDRKVAREAVERLYW